MFNKELESTRKSTVVFKFKNSGNPNTTDKITSELLEYLVWLKAKE